MTGDPAAMSLRDWALAFTQDRDPAVSGGTTRVGQDHRAWVGADAVEKICHHLAVAGTRAVTTLLAVLVHLRSTCWSNDGHDGRLTAGRPGSWESTFVRDLAWALDPIPEDAGLDRDAFTAVWDHLYGWVFDEARYVEVAENVARVTGRLVDGRGGWDQISDPWVRHLTA